VRRPDGLNLTAFTTEYSKNNKYDKLQIFKFPLKKKKLSHPRMEHPFIFDKGKCNTHDPTPMNTIQKEKKQ